jgi:GT2 family glycosyltransferase
MKNYPKVSILVVNWNRLGDTLECLNSIFKSDYPNFDVIVVDNGSTDRSVPSIRERFPQIIVLENAKNLGFTGGNNQGMRYALQRNADYVWLLNNDATTEPDTLTKLVKAVEEHAEVGLISPLIHYHGKSDEVQFSGIRLDIDGYSYREMPPHSLPDEDVSKMDNLLVGTALLIKRRVVEDIGYLDEKYFAYVEDFEYCMRAKRFGHVSTVLPSARVYHKDAEWKVKKRKPMVVFLRSRNTYFFWMGILRGRRRKFDYALHYLADRISFFSELRKEGHFEAADACLDAVWAALRGIGGPRDNNVKMPRVLKGILSYHPYFWVGMLKGNIKATFLTAVNRLRDSKTEKAG